MKMSRSNQDISTTKDKEVSDFYE